MKFEIRDSKFEGNPKLEPRASELGRALRLPIRNSDFLLPSNLEFRVSSFALALAIVFSLASTVHAQNAPRVGYLYPAGGRQGATFRVVVGGQYLGSVSNALVSGDGARAKVMEYNRPLNQKEFNESRDALKELMDQRQAWRRSPHATNSWTAADERKLEEIKAKILKNPPNRQGNPAIAETVTLEIQLARDAAPGEREIRLAAPNGLSNPLVFCVGQLPEFSEPPSRTVGPDIEKYLERLGRQPAPAKSESRVALPAIVNGQIMPGTADRHRFFARTGQRLVATVSARGLIPYLPDAVPGWFQATLALYDAKGRELAYADDFRFSPDPVLAYDITRDGEYVVEIKDAIYRGREDFVYRITVGELPVVTSLFPLGGPAGEPVAVELKGWNLPTNQYWTVAPAGVPLPGIPERTSGPGEMRPANAELEIDSSGPAARTVDAAQPHLLSPALSSAPPKSGNASVELTPGVHSVFVSSDDRRSNLVPFAVDTLPECREQEPNASAEAAQRVALPVIINGRIDPPGDTDVFSFEGRAGAEIVAEVNARRLNSPLDSVLRLTDAAGRQIAFNDDYEDLSAGLETHHADSCVRATLPADGTFFVHLGDTQRKGGGEYGYRLRLSPPQPDFALRAVPSSLSLRPGASVPLTVHALRKDGFTNRITLELRDAPSGFVLSGAQVLAGQSKVRLTLTAPAAPREPTGGAANRSAGSAANQTARDTSVPDRGLRVPAAGTSAPPEIFKLSLEGWATVDGRTLSRPVVPAEDMMQAFAYRHLVPARELAVAVAGRGMPSLRILGAMPVTIPAGGSARVRVGPAGPKFTDNFQLELSEPPEGIVLKSVSPVRGGVEIEIAAGAGVKPGCKDNLIVNVCAARPPGGDKGRGNVRRTTAGVLPAIPFEVIAPR